MAVERIGRVLKEGVDQFHLVVRDRLPALNGRAVAVDVEAQIRIEIDP